MPAPLKQSYSVQEVAEAVGVHADTIRAEIKRGNLEAWRAGNQLRVEPEAIEAWKKVKKVGQPPARRSLRVLER